MQSDYINPILPKNCFRKKRGFDAKPSIHKFILKIISAMLFNKFLKYFKLYY